jgi:membrane protease YdiL (CAAX protease family)
VTVGAFVFGVALITGAAQAASLLGFERLVTENTTVRFGLTVVLLQGVTFGTVALVYVRLRGLRLGFIRARIPTLRDVAWIVGGFLLLVIVAAVVSQFLSESGVESARNQIGQEGKENPQLFLLMIPLAFLLIGPGEELLFRGIVQGSLREAFSPVGAIGITSLVFAVGHMSALSGEDPAPSTSPSSSCCR